MSEVYAAIYNVYGDVIETVWGEDAYCADEICHDMQVEIKETIAVWKEEGELSEQEIREFEEQYPVQYIMGRSYPSADDDFIKDVALDGAEEYFWDAIG